MTAVHDRERELYREIAPQVERGLPGVEVLALELAGPERFCVYIDHPQGVDHALCERVTNVLRGYLDRYSVDVSSPGIERPLRTRQHFERYVGQKVALRTAHEIDGRSKFKGTIVEAGARQLALGAGGGERTEIPYDSIVRGNLVDDQAGR
jgi:ribosome maturation factor RimP